MAVRKRDENQSKTSGRKTTETLRREVREGRYRPKAEDIAKAIIQHLEGEIDAEAEEENSKKKPKKRKPPKTTASQD